MFGFTPFRYITKRGAGSIGTRGNPAGEFGAVVNPQQTARMPRHLRERFRLEKQKHIKDEFKSGSAPRTRQYTLCTKCGVSSVVINFDAVPSARIGMFGTCKNNTDYTHHKFRIVTKEDYELMQPMTQEQRVQWVFQQ